MPVAAVMIDIGAGHACVGDQVIEVALAAAAPAGSLAVGSVVLRPLSFGERLRLVREVAGRPMSTDTARALAASVLSASLVRGGAADVESAAVTESLALHLAGARLDVTSPGFADSAGLLAQAYGWSPADVTDAAADLMDHLARSLADPAGDDGGWTSVVLAGDAEAAGAGAAPVDGADVEGIRDRLAMDLLGRDAVPYSAAGLQRAGRPRAAAEQSRAAASGSESETKPGELPHDQARSGTELAAGSRTSRWRSRVSTNGAAASSPQGRTAASAPAVEADAWSDEANPEQRFTARPSGRPLHLHRRRQDPIAGSAPPSTGLLASLQPIAAGSAWSAPRGLPPGSEELDRSSPLPLGLSAARPDVARSTGVDTLADRLRAATGIAPSVASQRAPLDSERDDLFDLTDQLAEALNDEADLRGLRP